jgi:hypothetical protein
MIRKLHFIHRHNVLLSTSKKINHLCFELNGNEEIKYDSIVDIDNSVFYFSLYCKECKNFLLKPKEIVNFKVTLLQRNMKDLTIILIKKEKLRMFSIPINLTKI